MALRQGSVLSGRSGSMERAPSFGRATSGAVLKVRIKEAFDAVDADGNGVCGGTTALCSSAGQRGAHECAQVGAPNTLLPLSALSELTEMGHLQMQLEDPINDVDVIFAAVDSNNNGTIEIEEFVSMLDPVRCPLLMTYSDTTV
eukprot:3624030-Rhodomonas_salina.3